MDESLKLPELPKAAYSVWDDCYEGITLSENGPYDGYSERELFNLEQMQDYGLACARAALEEAAKRLELSNSELLLMAGEMSAQEKRTARAVLTALAAAIRNIKVGE